MGLYGILPDAWQSVGMVYRASVNIRSFRGYLRLNGDAARMLMDKYGWSYKKTNNLTKAVYLAKSYYGNDWLCSYVLVQNLIWSEIKENESPANYVDTF